jgi:NAD(P)-dependent dehydrogenase (short-subunit alcohol dehydrogenase family)
MSDRVIQSEPILNRFGLGGRAAVVTGAGQGIGRAYCHALADAGASVAVLDFNREGAERVASELEARGAAAMALVADVTKPEEVDAAIDTVVREWSSLTIGVNNAGICKWTDAESVSAEEWRSIVAVNYDGVFYCCQAEARAMMRTGYGKIINTASMSGHIVNTPQHQAAYNSSKAAVIHLTRSLAVEWAPRGIRVNSISPGYTRTELVDDLVATPEGARMMKQWMELVPMQRMIEVTDLQGAVVYLASGASDMMTGHDMVIDGGYCCV